MIFILVHKVTEQVQTECVGQQGSGSPKTEQAAGKIMPVALTELRCMPWQESLGSNRIEAGGRHTATGRLCSFSFLVF